MSFHVRLNLRVVAFTCLTLFVCTAKSVFAQLQKADSLEAQLNAVADAGLKLKIYLELAEQYDARPAGERNTEVILEGLALAEKIGDTFAKARLLRFQGLENNRQKPFDNATTLTYLEQALVLQASIKAKDLDELVHGLELAKVLTSTAFMYWKWGKFHTSKFYYDSAIRHTTRVLELDSGNYQLSRLLGMQHNSKGAAAWGLGDYEGAIASYFRALDYFEKLNLIRSLSLTSANIGIVYDSWGQKADAMLFFKRALKFGKESGDAASIAYALSCTGLLMENSGNYDSALYYYQVSADQYQNASDVNGITLNLNRLGKVYATLGKHTESMAVFTQALDLAEKSNAYHWQAQTKHNLAATLATIGQHGQALGYARESNDLAKREGYKEVEKDNYLILSRIHAQQKDYQQAYLYFQRYTTLKDSLFTEEKFREITRMKEHFEAEQKEKENELLRKDSLLHEQTLSRARIEKYSLLALLVGLSMFAVYFIVSKRKIKKINDKLTDKNQEVTRQKEELGQQAVQLQKSNEIKDLMFSIVSHDMRGPINNLEQLIAMLNDNKLSLDEFRQVLPNVAYHISHIHNLTDNLLYWAKSQMEGMKVIPKVFDLHELVKEKLPLFEKTAADKGIALQNNIVQDTRIYADPNMVDLVMRNLIGNAVKFCQTDDKISLLTTTANGTTTITVEDTGIGISPEYLDRLFHDIHFTTRGTRNEKGAGLGLMICQYFVQLNGGKIWVESKPGKGSRFHFSLPNKSKQVL